MSRCPRCNSCQSQWDAKPCDHCGWPRAEQRTALAILQELQSEINEEIDGGEECYGRDVLMTRWIEQMDSALNKYKKQFELLDLAMEALEKIATGAGRNKSGRKHYHYSSYDSLQSVAKEALIHIKGKKINA